MRKLAPTVLALAIVAIPIAMMIAWLSSRPSWQISARNSPQGIIVEVHKSNNAQPTYTTVLAGQTINTEFERETPMELPMEFGETTFHDQTLRPGRWTVVINETRIDIMERAMIVGGGVEIAPQE